MSSSNLFIFFIIFYLIINIGFKVINFSYNVFSSLILLQMFSIYVSPSSSFLLSFKNLSHFYSYQYFYAISKWSFCLFSHLYYLHRFVLFITQRWKTTKVIHSFKIKFLFFASIQIVYASVFVWISHSLSLLSLIYTPVTL